MEKMKLLMAIVHDEDGNKVITALNQAGFAVTKLCSSGGFLRGGNTTLLSGLPESGVDQAIDLIRQNSQRRKESILGPESVNNLFLSQPKFVEVGGATVFVTEIERFEKI